MTEHGDFATHNRRKRPRIEDEVDHVSSINTTEEVAFDDDDASICSDITAPPDSPPQEPTESGEYEISRTNSTDASEAARNLFLNPEYSDFKIVVRGHTFPAHKSIICCQSEYFTCVFRNAFIEKQESIIRITDESPKTIYRLLQYLYQKYYVSDPTPPPAVTPHNGTIQAPPAPELTPFERLQYSTRVNFTMYRVADKYGIPGLSRLAVYKQLSALRTHNTITSVIWSALRCYSLFEGRYDAMRMTHVVAVAKILWKMPQKEIFFPALTGQQSANHTQADGLASFHKLCASSGQFAFDTFQHLLWLQSHHGVDWPPGGEDGENERPNQWTRNAKGGWNIIYGWDFDEYAMRGFERRRKERDEQARKERGRLFSRVRRLDGLDIEGVLGAGVL